MGMVHYPPLNPPAAPVCSVCIANYNGVGLLDDCLQSILEQQGGNSIEIIVHDDASTDDSVTWLRKNYPQVEVLASAENVGFCISNNRMVEHARGEYILLLNNDAALFPDAMANLLKAAKGPSAGGILTLPQYDWTTGTLVDRGCLLDPFYNPVPNLDADRQDVAMVIGACLFLPRSTWKVLGGFPEWFGSIGEDLYLCCQARLRGWTVQVTPGSGYRHHQGVSFGGNRLRAEGLQTTYRRRRLSERNKTATLVVSTPTPCVWPLLALHLLALFVEGTALCALRRNVRIWREIYWPTIRSTVYGTDDLLAKRRQAQAQRRIPLRCFIKPFVVMPRKFSLFTRHGLPVIR